MAKPDILLRAAAGAPVLLAAGEGRDND
jgi:hypothetical protein